MLSEASRLLLKLKSTDEYCYILFSAFNKFAEEPLRYVVLMSYLATEKDYLAPINEFPTGKGFADIVYLPINVNSKSKPALIIEIKKDANAKVALEQIKERDYVSRVKEHTDNILLIGINYDSKTKQHTCSIEEYQK